MIECRDVKVTTVNGVEHLDVYIFNTETKIWAISSCELHDVVEELGDVLSRALKLAQISNPPKQEDLGIGMLVVPVNGPPDRLWTVTYINRSEDPWRFRFEAEDPSESIESTIEGWELAP